eukprot:CAMPEP_0195293214 /NCGR_PEP_ID=MMETSP0707-20130614/11984_1 /TAXON_ID=33640 /ORGANISM="Asterionellopsis glacialis, Strain CCMP134" /LENGTH=464 /DNA_ID=CAMNT_0040353877 /DNA_START=208 /DNA_END=1602 /DNA_ORIENTATION=-
MNQSVVQASETTSTSTNHHHSRGSVFSPSRIIQKRRNKFGWLTSSSSSSRSSNHDIIGRGGSITLPTETKTPSPPLTTEQSPQLLPHNTTATNTTTHTNATNAAKTIIPSWKQQLPMPLPTRKTLHRILIPNGNIQKKINPYSQQQQQQQPPKQAYIELYLLGTSHVSNDSSLDVQLLLQHVHPNVVFLELCSQRIGMLEPRPQQQQQQEQQEPPQEKISLWQRATQLKSRSEGTLTHGSAMGTTLLTKVQDGYAESLGVELGGEFRVAYEWCYNATAAAATAAAAVAPSSTPQPLHLVLGDRPLQLTLLRAWESLTLWGKIKVLGGLLISCLWQESPEDIQAWMAKILEDGDTDVLTESIAEMAKHFPSLERVIIRERDAFMAAKLYQTCRLLPSGQNFKLVAIVGAGHCPGMLEWFTNGNSATPEQLLEGVIETKKHPLTELQTVIHDVTELPIVVVNNNNM